MQLEDNQTIDAASTDMLDIEGLDVEYATQRGAVRAVRDVSITIKQGETLGIAGESGSGKSTLALAILQYLGENGRIAGGSIRYKGQELQELSTKELQSLRGNEIAHVAQDAKKALNPSITVGEQIAETVREHRDMSKSEANEHAMKMIQDVGIPDAEYTAAKYPHELSGGQQQRVLLAIALSCNPSLLVLDEPTTGLDVTTQTKIIDLIDDLKNEFETTIVVITHNLEIIAQIADSVAIMYAGEMMEQGSVEDIFTDPSNPYTQGLLAATPEIGTDKAPAKIPGTVPSLTDIPSGCIFADRCEFAEEACHDNEIDYETVHGKHKTRCRRWKDVRDNAIEADQGSYSQVDSGQELLRVSDVKKFFDEPTKIGKLLDESMLGDYFEIEPPAQALRGVNLTLHEGETIGLVGESGSGKSTLGRVMLQLLNTTAGTVQFRGQDISSFSSEELRDFYSECQIVFQNPHSSLNPRKTISDIVGKPLKLFTSLDAEEREERVKELLNQVDLGPEYMHRYPHELSGGEKQRVAIGRAFAPNPSLVILDEPVSALDVSVQANLLNLLADLREEYGTAYFFISHDLSVVSAICDRINVMYMGEIVESGSRNEIFEPPYHPYTRALLSSIPSLDPHDDREPIRLESDVPSVRDPPSGCSFHTRCPQKIGEECENNCAQLESVSDSESHRISCHLPKSEISEALRDSTDEN